MNLIKGKGSPGPLMIIGDYPTQNEYSAGESFVGSTGNLLFNLFSPFQVNFKQIYKTHYFKVPVAGYASPIAKQRKVAVEKARALDKWDWYIKEEIEVIEPNVILACGELALQALTENSSIKKWRGSILHLHERFQRPNIKVVPIYSPREIWEQNEEPVVYTQWDVGRAVKIRDLKQKFKIPETLWIVRNYSELNNWWQRASRGEFLTLDIETHHGFITCISFSHDGKEAISIPLLVGPKVDQWERGRYYKLIDEILRCPVPKVNQNIKYDWTVLQNFGFEINNIIGDTMLMAHTIYPELPKGLDFLTSIYTDVPYYKDEGRKYDPKLHSSDRLLLYNAMDSLVTWQVWKAQLEDAEALKVKNFYFQKVHPTFFTYKKMDDVGIRVDDTRRKKLIGKYQPQLEEIQQTISLVAEEHINILSPAQVGRFIYDILKCPKMTHVTPNGVTAYSTDEESIEELFVNKVSDQSVRKLLKELIVGRKLAKVIQFLENPISPDGRMRTSYKLHGTKTGRTSAGKSIEPYFYINEKGKIREAECGGSFQTIPKHGYEFGPVRIGDDLRSIFVPSPGWCFVEGDQGQAEDRVVCVLAEDWDGLSVLNKTDFIRNKFGLKDDRHTLTAMLITSKPFEEITKDDRQERGKKPRHAGNYNMGSGMLAILTHLPHGECKRILEKFHSTNPKIRGIFHTEIRHIIDKRRYLITPHGRRRDFYGRITEEAYKQSFSTIPQATVSDHNKFTILRNLVESYPESDILPIAESHDSLTFEVRIEVRDKFIEDFDKAIRTPINFSHCSLARDYELVIPGEINWSAENWGEVK